MATTFIAAAGQALPPPGGRGQQMGTQYLHPQPAVHRSPRQPWGEVISGGGGLEALHSPDCNKEAPSPATMVSRKDLRSRTDYNPVSYTVT